MGQFGVDLVLSRSIFGIIKIMLDQRQPRTASDNWSCAKSGPDTPWSNTPKQKKKFKTNFFFFDKPITYQIERESKANSGLSSNPANKTKIWKYHVSKHNITADAAESLKNNGSPENALRLNPAQVSLHLSLFTI